MRTLLAEPSPPQCCIEPGIGSLRLAFLGVGPAGRRCLEAFAGSGVAQVGAIADPVSAHAEEAARIFPRAAVLKSLDQLLEVGVDGIVIATPGALQAEQAIAALERGVAVFCQKLLGRTAAETQRIVDAARDADLLLGTDLPCRQIPCVRQIHDLCRSGELGDVYSVDLTFHNVEGPGKAWVCDRTVAGDGCVIDLGSHLVDLAFWNLGIPSATAVESRLFSGGKPVRGRGGPAEDHAIATLRLSDGATVKLACSRKLPAGCDAVIAGAFYGTNGGASFHNVNGSLCDFRAERFRGTQTELLAHAPGDWDCRSLVEWAQRLEDGVGFDPEADGFVRVAESLDAIYAGAPAEPAGRSE